MSKFLHYTHKGTLRVSLRTNFGLKSNTAFLFLTQPCKLLSTYFVSYASKTNGKLFLQMMLLLFFTASYSTEYSTDGNRLYMKY